MPAAVPLIIGAAEKAQLQQLRELAARYPVEMPGLLARIETVAGKRRHMRQMNRQTIQLPVLFFVTFSIETGRPCGVARHMSMSVKREGRAPVPEAVWMAAEELGFTGSLEACTVWLETLSDGGIAVNVVQPVAGGAAESATRQ